MQEVNEDLERQVLELQDRLQLVEEERQNIDDQNHLQRGMPSKMTPSEAAMQKIGTLKLYELVLAVVFLYSVVSWALFW